MSAVSAASGIARLAFALVVARAAGAAARPGPSDPPVAPGGDSAFAGSGIADWSTPPPPTAEPAFTPPAATQLRLSSGLTVVVIENHQLPLVALTLVVPGAGSSADPPERLGLAAFTADLLDEGAAELSALQIAEAQEQLGAELDPYVDEESAGISARTLRKTLGPTLELLGKVVRAPTFAAADVERVRGDRLTALRQRRDRPGDVARAMLVGALYGARTPEGHPVAGFASDVAACTAAELREFYRTRWRLERSTLVVAGDVTAEALRATLEATLGGAGAAATAPAASPAPTRSKAPRGRRARLLFSDRPGAVQSEIRVGLRGPRRDDPRFTAFEVARTALGDGFTSRLNQRLREQLGITYGVRAVMDWRRASGPFSISAALVSDATATGIAEILSIVRGLAARELPEEELARTKQNLIRALPAEFETNLSTALAFGELVRLDLPLTWHAQYLRELRAVTAKQVRAAAAGLLPARGMSVSVVGDLAKLARPLRALGLGRPRLHGPEGLAATPAR
ncbi:MAG: pitrilysin family protein [Kofleriaceae bacterium]